LPSEPGGRPYVPPARTSTASVNTYGASCASSLRDPDGRDLELDVDRLGERDASTRDRRDGGPPAREDHHRERDVAAPTAHVGDEAADPRASAAPTRAGERATDQRRRQPRAIGETPTETSASGRSPAARKRSPTGSARSRRQRDGATSASQGSGAGDRAAERRVGGEFAPSP